MSKSTYAFNDDVDTFMDPMSVTETRPCEVRLPPEAAADLERLIRQARFEPEKAFLHLLTHYAEEPLRTLAQVYMFSLIRGV